jgi:asparagine synthase (glutamine-hydrolysing)
MPARYDDYNLLERLGAAKVFTREFLGAVDPELPAAEVARSYGETEAGSLINHMLALDFKYTLADNDLPKVARSCELAGLEVRFPLLSDAVVAFSASLAPDLKLRRTQLRYFFKQALRGFLPQATIDKRKHGFGLPFGPWLRTHRALRQFAWDSLEALKKRRLVRPEFVDELGAARIGEHADYYGTMVWVLVMLEQWFSRRKLVI